MAEAVCCSGRRKVDDLKAVLMVSRVPSQEAGKAEEGKRKETEGDGRGKIMRRDTEGYQRWLWKGGPR